MKQLKTFILFLILLSYYAYPQTDVEKFTIRDFLKLTTISSPQFSPDGKFIVFIQGDKETWDGKRNMNLWLANLNSNKIIKLTNSDKSDWDPQFSPDGSMVAFLSSRSEKTQIYLINISGGEARAITSAKEGVRLFHWINNSKIAFVTDLPRDSSLIAAEEKAGGGYEFGSKAVKSLLWTKLIDPDSSVVKITDGSYYISDMAASTDGKKYILITCKNSDLYNQYVENKVILVDENGNIKFTFQKGKVFSTPGISPDNSKISFVGCTVGFSSNNSLFVTDLKSFETINLTENFDPTIESVRWLDSDNITFKTPRNVHSGIYSIKINDMFRNVSKNSDKNESYMSASPKVETLMKPFWVINSYDINLNTKEISFVGSNSQVPNELYLYKIGSNSKDAKLLKEVNKCTGSKKLGSSKIINYPSYDGTKIEAVLTLPPGYDKTKKYPLMVCPHGGPDGIVMDGFSLFGQIFAEEGIIVFQPNFRGSIGYGSKFYEANRGKLGYVDYDDIMSGVDYLIKENIVDSTKMVVGGWSYGGYMTDWIIGHTNRFKAAVSVAGIANTVSMYAESDINHGEIAQWEFKGVPVINMENFTRSSPLTFLHKCITPTLIMHGEADDRVPMYQGWELYRALVDLGVEVKFVLYPGASHGISAPKQFENVFTRWVNWYNRFLK